MKVAQVCPFFFPVDGGVENHVLNISKELVKRGHEVDIYTSADTREHSSLGPFDSVQGLSVRRSRVIGRMGEFASFWPGFAPQVLKGDYDLVHAHSYRHPHTDMSALIAKVTGAASVLTGHSPFHPPGVRSNLSQALVPAYDELVAPFTLRAYSRVISVTKAEADLLIGLGAPSSRVSVIPNGVEAVHFEKADFQAFIKKFSLEGKRVLLYLGRINRTKGVEVLLRAFAKASPKIPDVQLVVAGPATGPGEVRYSDNLRALSDTLGISERVSFTGRLSEADKLAALEYCSALVLPSLYEPYGIVLLEAAAHGKPSIATKTDGPISLIRNGVNGLLVDPGDEQSLAGALSLLMNDEGLRSKLSAEARLTASEFRWERIVDKIEGVYSSVRPAS
ncbi:MAG: glycosyltransferase family 4 protein [Thaumarchaeota archaeon]|nr:glycosyltransferase family 4 protein [Nitrososphaerota archaeon]